MPTSDERDRRAADLRSRAALVRANGWADYENIWSTGEVLGVRAVLGEPGAVDAAVEAWAATLWGVGAAEADARTSYRSTRRWFAAVAQAVSEVPTETEPAGLPAGPRTVGELRAILRRVPDDTLLLTDGYEGGFTGIAAATLVTVQQLDRGDHDWLGDYDTVENARQAVESPLPLHDAAVYVGEPALALVLTRAGR